MSLTRTSLLLPLGVLHVRGTDAITFLQGQVSNDVAQLSPSRALLAGYHNPQGRVIALLRLLQPSPGEVLAVLPRELATTVAARLAKFILRAKVTVTDVSAQWTVTGLVGSAAGASDLRPADDAGDPPGTALPPAPDVTARLGASLAVRLGGEPGRWLLITPAAQPAAPAGDATGRQAWQRLAVAAGEPQVYARTSEEFVAQMLNLDALGAIAFDKGCYTGQEVIARAHYRGRVKRRMQRFVSTAPVLLQPADAGVLEDGRPFKVVDAIALDDGRSEFLAVTPLVAGAPDAEGGASGTGHGQRLGAEPLPLPYALPL